MTEFVAASDIRARFSAAMSAMYRAEVPLYADLLGIVADVNRQHLAADPALATRLAQAGDLARLDAERHGAIRVGTGDELRALRRVFAVMGMAPVGYYDLAAAGVPVHSTAFRPVDAAGLAASPFRVFTSLLRLELIEDTALRGRAAGILAGRRIVSDRCMALVAKAEAEGGLGAADAEALVAQALDIFRWHEEANVDLATYHQLLGAHRLVADIVAFRGPHINHLTPRTLDIDAAQAEMLARGLAAKDTIEGPPPRKVPILLRQTSFLALNEAFRPLGGTVTALHTARFGEIEQRGAALTPAGHALYDRCLAAAQSGDAGIAYAERLATAFALFPDDLAALRRAGLAYVRYALAPGASALAPGQDLESAIAAGLVDIGPITYEDFLPVSAAGIFRSNLADEVHGAYKEADAQDRFEADLGCRVIDPFTLYAETEAVSARALGRV